LYGGVGEGSDFGGEAGESFFGEVLRRVEDNDSAMRERDWVHIVVDLDVRFFLLL
jgi:hypothetical protein